MDKKITSRTRLATIKRLILEDFGVEIDLLVAKDIKEANKKGTLLWTNDHLIITDQRGLQINKSGVS